MAPTPSLALGAYEVTPLELTNSYATFASGGIYSAFGVQCALTKNKLDGPFNPLLTGLMSVNTNWFGPTT